MASLGFPKVILEGGLLTPMTLPASYTYAHYELIMVPLPVALRLISAELTRTLVREAIRPFFDTPNQVPPPLRGCISRPIREPASI